MFASPRSFAYHAPASIAEALALLAELGPGARVLAGGCDLVPELRRRRSSAEAVVSLAAVPGLGHVDAGEGELRIGAMASLRAVERAPAVRERYAALHDGIRSIASVQVRATGTLIGNLCVATPASDIAPPLLVLGAELRVARAGGERRIGLGELYAGAKRHTLAPGELVVEAHVPAPPPGAGSAFAKLTRTAADCAKLNVAAHVVLRGRTCVDVRIALGSLAPTPVRAVEAEAILTGHALDEALLERAAAAAVAGLRPITDLRSTADYRRRVARVLVRRVVERAVTRAGGAA